MAKFQPISDLLDYVDTEDALKRVCGNKIIYKKLLGSFKTTLQLEKLCGEVAADNLEEASRTAHSIKGVCANLSLKAAFEQILEVETHLKAGKVEPGDMDKLRAVMEKTLECTEYVAANL